MRLVIQRVQKASVSVDKRIVGKISKGLFVLFGVQKDDSEKDAINLADKLSKLRIMQDSLGKMNLTLNEVQGEVLVVSQFTLYGDTSGGNRPSFIKAAEPLVAEKLYNTFIDRIINSGIKVQTGEFGKYMTIDCKLDGPVTIIMESKF